MSENEEMIKLENLLCFTIYASSREITRMYRPVLDKFGLTYPQYLVLVVLWEVGHCTVTELGEKLLLDSGTLTPLLKRMQEADLVIRKRSLEDERKVEVSLTAKGESLKPQLQRAPETIFADICKTETNYEELLGQLKQLLADVQKTANK